MAPRKPLDVAKLMAEYKKAAEKADHAIARIQKSSKSLEAIDSDMENLEKVLE